ncbi:hypothetical protein N7530_009528 [Penicillium desertorum]|uniref:C2H2 type zinc finger domain protein n=1 Tax=Penicillium desertorum TaxID=1303715 RepID=A0A9W9WJ61_9EURO|nr:hypothetical protein N7530_009528 [Penicillium desertorum]
MANLGNEIDLPPQSPIEVNSHTFRCHFPGCNASYRRKEHLHRHEGKHSQQQAFPCTNCGREFGRSDTLRRHLRQRHGIIEPLKRAQRACESCHAGKSRCEGGVPCNECIRRKIPCSFNDPTSTVEDPSSGSETQRASSANHDQPRLQNTEKTEQCVRLYFETFHPFWPFIHKATFDIRQETPLLVQSMVVIGLWATREQSAQSAAVELHGKLDLALRDQKEKWDASEAARARSTCVWPIPTYQAILLHIMFSFVISNRDAIDFDLKVSLPLLIWDYSELLSEVVESWACSIIRTFLPSDLDSFIWVGIEEIKRFNIALYKVCGKASSSSIRDGTHGDTHAWSPLTAGELQFPLPSNCALWSAVTRDEWDAVAKDEKRVSLDDDRQKDWISNFAEILQVFEF